MSGVLAHDTALCVLVCSSTNAKAREVMVGVFTTLKRGASTLLCAGLRPRIWNDWHD